MHHAGGLAEHHGLTIEHRELYVFDALRQVGIDEAGISHSR